MTESTHFQFIRQFINFTGASDLIIKTTEPKKKKQKEHSLSE